jgi:hypothetical protein
MEMAAAHIHKQPLLQFDSYPGHPAQYGRHIYTDIKETIRRK